jgi:hypothetical protein
MVKARKSEVAGEHLRRVRRIGTGLLETTEKLSHGEPTFFRPKRVYLMFANNHHNGTSRCGFRRRGCSRRRFSPRLRITFDHRTWA